MSPGRDVGADGRAHVHDGAEFLLALHGEGHDVRAVVVHHRHHVRASLVDRAVNEALRIGLAGIVADDVARMGELGDVDQFDAIGSASARHQEVVRIFRMADRHVAEGIHYVVVGEHLVRRDEIFLELFQFGHARPPVH